MSNIRMQPRWEGRWLLALAIGLLGIESLSAQSIRVTRTGAEPELGQWLGWQEEQLRWQTGGGARMTPWSEIVDLRFETPNSESTGGEMVIFRDGSRLVASELAVIDNRVRLADLPDETGLATGQIAALVFREQTTEEDRLERDRLIGASGRSSDALIAKRSSGWAAIEGVVRAVSSESIRFSIDDQTAEIPRERVAAITFLATQTLEPKPLKAELKLIDGSQLKLNRWTVDNGQWRVTTAAGIELVFPTSRVRSLAQPASTFTLLSDLVPTSNDWEPLLAHQNVVSQLAILKRARRNQSYQGRPLELLVREPGQVEPTRVTFAEGWAMQGGGRLVFSLGGKFQRLSGRVGFAPRESATGDVELKIQGDGQTLWEQSLNRLDQGAALSVDIKVESVQRLVIQVGHGKQLSVGDVLHLVDWKLE